MQTKFIR